MDAKLTLNLDKYVIDKGIIELIVSALTYSTVYYLLTIIEDKKLVKEKIRKFKIVPLTSDLSGITIDKGRCERLGVKSPLAYSIPNR
jgi:hypothetical protein